MKKCGYIYLADDNTNEQDVIKIISCPCSSIEDAPYQDNLSTYVIHKMTFKILSKDTHPLSRLSHLALMDVAKTAVSFDKELKYPAVLTFTFDKDENVNLKFKSYIKEVFPLPDKTYVYGDKKYLLNITDCFCDKDCLSNLSASIICDYLNVLSVNSGLLQDRFFSYSCGRIFMDATFFLKSFNGREFLKNNFSAHYKLILENNLVLPISQKLNICNKHKTENTFSNDYYKNNVIKSHSLSVRRVLDEVTFFELSEFFNHIYSISEEEIESIKESIYSLVKNGAIEKYQDSTYLSIDDILGAFSIPDTRALLKNRCKTNRLFYRESEGRDIKLIFSDGKLVEKLYDFI